MGTGVASFLVFKKLTAKYDEVDFRSNKPNKEGSYGQKAEIGIAKKNSKYCYVNTDENPVFNKWFEKADHFDSDDVAVVQEGGKYYLIDKTGKEISGKFDYLECYPPNERIVRAKDGNQWFYLDKITGKEITSKRFDRIGFFCGNLAVVRKGRDFYLIDRDGELYGGKFDFIYDADIAEKETTGTRDGNLYRINMDSGELTLIRKLSKEQRKEFERMRDASAGS